MSVPEAVPSWIGQFAIRAAACILGVLIAQLALALFGVGKATSPFASWASWLQFIGIAVGVTLLLLLEQYVEYRQWTVEEPKKYETNVTPPKMN